HAASSAAPAVSRERELLRQGDDEHTARDARSLPQDGARAREAYVLEIRSHYAHHDRRDVVATARVVRRIDECTAGTLGRSIEQRSDLVGLQRLGEAVDAV